MFKAFFKASAPPLRVTGPGGTPPGTCAGGGGTSNPSKKSEWSSSKAGSGRAVGAGELRMDDDA